MDYMVNLQATPDEQMAAIARGQYQYYKDNYIPFENRLIAEATGSQAPHVQSLLSKLAEQQRNMNAIQQRTMSRYGASIDPRVLDAMQRRSIMSDASGLVRAKNTLSQNLYDQNLSVLGMLASLGRGLSSQATEGINTAMQNQAARDAQYAQAMQAYRNAKAQYNSSPFTLFGLL